MNPGSLNALTASCVDQSEFRRLLKLKLWSNLRRRSSESKCRISTNESHAYCLHFSTEIAEPSSSEETEEDIGSFIQIPDELKGKVDIEMEELPDDFELFAEEPSVHHDEL